MASAARRKLIAFVVVAAILLSYFILGLGGDDDDNNPDAITDIPFPTRPPKKPDSNGQQQQQPVKKHNDGDASSSSSTAGGAPLGATRAPPPGDALDEFVNDPSFATRCKETAAPRLPHCDAFRFERESRPLPPLIVPRSHGATTAGMEQLLASDVLGRSVAHHPIFAYYANSTAFVRRTPRGGDSTTAAPAAGGTADGGSSNSSSGGAVGGKNAAGTAIFDARRVLEFNGVHTEYSFDCEDGVDFRNYHQVRAALCLAHESFDKGNLSAVRDGISSSDVFYGQYPLVDEEYMEYVMTLVTARDAALRGSPYTFIELGARYGTWAVRAGVSYRSLDSTGQLSLVAVEGNCGWFQHMVEHVRCNGLSDDARLIHAYAAPKSFNKVDIGQPATYKEPRSVSLLQLVEPYDYVDMIDFDIQGFEWMAVEEPGVRELLTRKVGVLHFGTHSTEIEQRLLGYLQASYANGGADAPARQQWCVGYFYAGAHTKKLHNGHRCETPYGPAVHNDGVLGFFNLNFYPQLRATCNVVPSRNKRSVAHTCFWMPEVLSIIDRPPKE